MFGKPIFLKTLKQRTWRTAAFLKVRKTTQSLFVYGLPKGITTRFHEISRLTIMKLSQNSNISTELTEQLRAVFLVI